MDWFSCGVFGHNDQMKNTVRGEVYQAHKGGRQGKAKVELRQSKSKVIGITSKSPLFIVATSLDLAKLVPLENRRDSIKWLVSLMRPVLPPRPRSRPLAEGVACLDDMVRDPNSFQMLRYIDRTSLLAAFDTNTDVGVLTTLCYYAASFADYAQDFAQQNQIATSLLRFQATH